MKAPGRGILEYVPGLASIPVTMNLGMAPESWSEPGHSVPRRAQEGCGHEEAVIAAVALRQPLPDHEPDPVDHLVRPDPDQQAAIDLDLAYALHPGTQVFGRALKSCLAPEGVPAFARRRDRRDLLDGERQALHRGGGQEQLSLLSDGHVRDVALVDLEDHAVRLERRHLEQHLAALDRGAERLAQIPLDDDAVERRHEPCARELVIEQR